MGVLRGGLLFILGILFFSCILIQGFFLTIYLSLDYNTVKPQISSIASNILEQQGVSSQFNESFVQEQVSTMVEEKYSNNYDCKFFDCIQKTNDPFSLVSKHAQNYWKIKFFSALIIFFILALIIFFLVEHKSNFFLLSSVLFASSSIVFFKLDILAKFILEPFLNVGETVGNLSSSSILNMFSIFWSKSFLVFAWFIGIAIFFLIVWGIMELYEIGFEISRWFNKKEDSSVVQVQSSNKFEQQKSLLFY
jgi:hypothetical protein